MIQGVRPRGVHFPFTRRADGFPSADGPPDIFVSNIKQILLTMTGERVMRPTFGSAIKAFVFSGIPSPFLEEQIKAGVKQAIDNWEPRVRIFNIDVSVEDTKVKIVVLLLSPTGPGVVELNLRKT